MYRLSFQIIFLLLSLNIFAQSPHGNDFDKDCSLCHSSDSWKVEFSKVNFDHSQTKFDLVGQHQHVDCKSCHTTLVFSSVQTDCFSCHKDIHQSTVGYECANCHAPTSWIVKDIIGIHQSGRFPLVGAHRLADCAQCHSGYTELKFDVLNVDCYACHSQDYNSAQSPNHISANFSTDCQECHNVNAPTWNTTNVNHSFFPLSGGHALPDCFSCHQQDTFSGLSPECYSCHQQTYVSTTNPNHQVEGLPTTCEVCHNINGWSPASFNHNVTQFPLTGKHIDVDCATCHTSGYTGTSADCYACHQSDYQTAIDPNHVNSQFPTDCSLCHTTSGWEGATFDHNQSIFPLTGSHVQVDCASCHISGYSGTPTNCYACHQQDYESTTDPNHVLENYPQDCTVCHNTTSWNDANFDHNLSQFPLTGAHVTVACANCHTSGYTGTPTDCVACHQIEYNNTTNPNHQSAGFPTTCVDCHSTNAWEPATFDHDNQYFPIYSGKHNGEWNQCSECHTIQNNFTVFSCIDCHEHNRTDTDDKHQGVQGYVYNSADCFACHPTGRKEGAFNHANSSFPLTGSHITIECAQCHQNGYTGTSTLCEDCHISSFNNTTNPNHSAAGLSTECSSCHNAIGWSPSTFDHITTGFTLLGAHQPLQCSSCHNGTTSGLTNDCISCHQSNYNSAANHITQSYPTTCEQCHNSSAWNQTSFDHQNTNFPLTGAHTNTTCQQCHTSGYTGTSTECLACHQNAFNNAVNPNHATAGIPTSCESCHNSTAWIPSSFNHTTTGFELIGGHQPIQCSSCHVGTVIGLNNECVTCHQAQFNTASNHTSQSYPTTCELCHNSIAWNQASFDHQNTNFPLTGAHTNTTCQQCHSAGYTGTSTECFACHQTDYQQSTNPNHSSLVLSTTCQTCHTTNPSWTPATFPVHNNFFQLLGAHLQINDCTDCHQGNYNTTPNTCIGCHSNDYNGTTDPPHQTLNFSDDCLTCHTMNGWTPATFNHNFFPVNSHHNNVDCNQCHSETNYQPQCLSCHMDDFLDEHDLGDRTDCWNCHTASNWSIGLIRPHKKSVE